MAGRLVPASLLALHPSVNATVITRQNAALATHRDPGVTLTRIRWEHNERAEPAGAGIIKEAIKQQGNGSVHNPSCQEGSRRRLFYKRIKKPRCIMGNAAVRGDAMIKSLHCNTCEEVRP